MDEPPRHPRVLVTAGPTREPIDAVRFVSNRSSGAMGMAIADAAAEAGCDVTLLLGPVLAPTTLGERVTVERFSSTADLQALLAEHFPACELLIMAAAVADYRMRQVSAGKAARSGSLKLELEATPDLVAEVAQRKRDDQRIVAFALEEAEAMEGRAVEKMRRKGVDAIVANPLATMEDGRVDAVYLTAAGERERPGLMSKPDFARWLVRRVV